MKIEITKWWANPAAPVNAPVASLFQFEHSCRRVTEQRRYTPRVASMGVSSEARKGRI
jgi:hypothetical protein